MNIAKHNYHFGCKATVDEFTDNVPGQLAEILRRAKRRCEKEGIKYGLGTDIQAMRLLLDLFESQNGVCPLTGLEMVCETDHDYGFLLKPSIDRLNNARGYEPDNLRLTTVWGNLQRNFLSDDQFYRLCKSVVGEYERGKRTMKSKRRGKENRQNRNKPNLR
jgi:hypothetical protein